MRRVLVTGANGLVGQKLVAALAPQCNVLATARQETFQADPGSVEYQQLDIADGGACKELVLAFNPDVIVNSAAFTHVDACEEQRELCWQVNVKGVANLAHAARKNMAKLIHISTDYVFNGEQGPYAEEAKPNPIGYYGKAKLASENEVRIAGIPYAIVRTNVVYGDGVGIKNNFFLWVYNSLAAGKTIRVVTDQYNNPVLADDLAEGIRLLIDQSKYGVFNIQWED